MIQNYNHLYSHHVTDINNTTEILTIDKIKFARPGTGISANEFKYVNNRKVNREIPSEEILQWDMIQ